MSIQKALPELPAEVWLEIFDMVGPTAHVPCVCRYFKELYTTRVTRWAEHIVDILQDCHKQQSPARGIPKGHAVTYDQGKSVIKYFKNKIDAARSELSSDEQEHYKIVPSRSLAVHPESLSTLLPMIDEIELVNLLRDELPVHLRTAPRSEKMRALTTLTWLDLSKNHLTTLPGSIGNLTALSWLNLSDNKLTILPDSIGNLTALSCLYLFKNQLTTLPDSIGNLTALTRLYLSNNHLTILPDSIGNLTVLTTLYLCYNHLTTLPDSIGNLTALTTLYLCYDQFITLPDSFSNLSALRFLLISGTRSLAESPQSIIQLRRLRDKGCRIASDIVVHQAIMDLPEIPGEPPAKQQKCLTQ